MSLDVYLKGPEEDVERHCDYCGHDYTEKEGEELFSANITHNLNSMAEAAGIYYHLWRPEEIGVTRASQLIEPLTKALEELVTNRKRFEGYNPPNGWGTYDGFVNFVRKYRDACLKYPDAFVHTDR